MENKHLDGVYIGIPNTDISPMFTNIKNLKNPNGFELGTVGSGKEF